MYQQPMYPGYAPIMPQVQGTALVVPKVGQQFPWLCMKCGAPHGPAMPLQTRAQSYRWVPPWTNWLILIGVVPALIVQSMYTKTAQMQFLLCAPCNAQWKQGRIAVALSVLVPFALCAIGVGIAVNTAGSASATWVFSSLGVLLFGIVLVPGLVHFLYAAPRLIRTDYIDDYTIRLIGVHPAVLAAFQQPHRPY
jgi:hypothetical protein